MKKSIVYEKYKRQIKLLIKIIFLVYFIILLYGILFKGGDSVILARHMSKFSLKEKISFIQIIPFKTIIDFLNEDLISFITNVVLNVLAFVPLGFLLPILSKKNEKQIKIFFIAFLISLSIELIQLFSGIGFCDIDDIILNVLGALLGFFAYKMLFKITNRLKQIN